MAAKQQAESRRASVHYPLTRVPIGLSGSHFHGPFAQFMHAMRIERPRLEIVLNEMRPADHIEALRDRRLDVSLSRATINDAQIESRLLTHLAQTQYMVQLFDVTASV